MLKNAYLLANIGADTAENEQHFAENVGKIGRRVADRRLARWKTQHSRPAMQRVRPALQ